MFPKKQRISSVLFTSIMKKGKRSFTRFFRMKFMPSNTLAVSVAISKKIIKKRIARNKEKRRILHILKNVLSEDTNYHIVISIQKDTQVLNHPELSNELSTLLAFIKK